MGIIQRYFQVDASCLIQIIKPLIKALQLRLRERSIACFISAKAPLR